jgi:hypothetical protein
VPLARRLAWLPLLALSACAHKPLSPAAAAAPTGEALPRFCVQEECDAIVSHNTDIESCECAARQYDDTLGARVDLVFAVPAGGGKAQVTVGRAVAAPEMLRECVLQRAASWSFPAPSGGAARFRTGIIFAPDGGGPCPPGPSSPVRRATAPKERVRAALAAHRDDVKACYQEALGPGVAVKARAVLTLMFNRNGEVIQAQVDEAAPRHERAERCITDRAYEWQMPRPAPAGVVTASYPYTLGEDTGAGAAAAQ